MNTVTPTRIVDKNGKSTTVYRRLDEGTKVSASLGGRMPKSAAADKKRQAWLGQPMFGYMAKGENVALYEHADLKTLLGAAETTSGTFYTLAQGTTQGEFASMLSVASVPTVLRVSGTKGIKSGDELCEFLEANDLSHLIEDNSEQVELMEKRMVDAGTLIESLDRMMSPDGAGCSWADFAEVLACRSLTDTEVVERVWSGEELSWDYVKSVGVSNFSQFASEILGYEDELTPDQIKSAIAIVKSGSNVVPGRTYKATRRDDMNEVVYAMVRMGPDEALAMRVPGLFRELNQQGLLTGMPDDQKAAAARFVDEFVHRIRETSAEVGTLTDTADRERLKDYPEIKTTTPAWGKPVTQEYVVPFKEVISFYAEGISVDDSIAYISRGIDAVKARGLIDNDIAPSVSDGWL